MEMRFILLFILSFIVYNGNGQVQDTIFLENDQQFIQNISLTEASNYIDNISLNTFEERFKYLNQNTSLSIDYNEVSYYYVKKYLKYKWLSKIIGLSAYYFPLFEAKLKQYGLPEELKYLAVVESNLNPRAISSAGAKGLWQFMPATGKEYGLFQNQYVNTFYDPVASTDAAARYLRDLYNEFKDWNLVLSAYNCGQGRIRSLIQKHKTSNYWKLRPYMPKETQAYVPTFIAINYIFNFYKDHQMNLSYFKYTFFDFQITKSKQKQRIPNDPLFRFANPHILTKVIPEGVYYYH